MIHHEIPSTRQMIQGKINSPWDVWTEDDHVFLADDKVPPKESAWARSLKFRMLATECHDVICGDLPDA